MSLATSGFAPRPSFRLVSSPASAALHLKVSLGVVSALLVGIALGAASIAPQSGWRSSPSPVVRDAGLAVVPAPHG